MTPDPGAFPDPAPDPASRAASRPRALDIPAPAASRAFGHDPELQRALLETLGLLDTGHDAALDSLVLAAANACGRPVAALSFSDGHGTRARAWHGLDDHGLTAHAAQALLQALGVPERAFDCSALAGGGTGDIDGPPALPLPWCHAASEPLRAEGRVIGALVVADTAPRPPLAPAARHALRALADVAEALLAARLPGAELHGQALRRRQELLARASREMRTPLNAVVGFSQLLQLEPVLINTRAHAWVQQIELAAQHLTALVDEMLMLARLQAGTQRLLPRPLALAPIVADVVAMLGPQAAARGVALELEVPPALRDAAVLADARALRQIVINLLCNAIEHSPDATPVRVVLALHGTLCEVAVHDQGEGISAADQVRLFEPFERVADPARQRPGGLGLGLVTSRQLAEGMGGTIAVRSAVGQGSTFTLKLPAG